MGKLTNADEMSRMPQCAVHGQRGMSRRALRGWAFRQMQLAPGNGASGGYPAEESCKSAQITCGCQRPGRRLEVPQAVRHNMTGLSRTGAHQATGGLAVFPELSFCSATPLVLLIQFHRY